MEDRGKEFNEWVILWLGTWIFQKFENHDYLSKLGLWICLESWLWLRGAILITVEDLFLCWLVWVQVITPILKFADQRFWVLLELPLETNHEINRFPKLN
jgi:hypothetical protein